ncbi:hypothetical protein NA57DRAFT_35882 [Rhizodiscina lignyota]|uniref:Uncharacterized protein n=1 Tax=Rhizodiscina lignyota TaxID=1504668 RepID=A0A9P4M8L6_9PEZI|nr:hypothetical protein NA57DRAFT_35882 [Rhizodiscina lignyota]
MPPKRTKPHTVGSASFDPDKFFDEWTSERAPQGNNLQTAVIDAFNLKSTDDYVYHAIASVTLPQVQSAINHGASNGMHAWYLYDDAKKRDAPPSADIKAYTDIFLSTTVITKALTAFAANAKKESTRAEVAKHLQSNLHLPPTSSKLALPSKLKVPHKNPYLDYWIWSCQCLEWTGPTPGTAMIQQSHHILPVLYHHFGCVCPTYDALSLVQQVCRGSNKNDASKSIVEVGSGNGYWAYLLRRIGLTVHAVDNEASLWRTTWIGDTIIADGISFLHSPPGPYKELGKGANNAVLLLVYPQVTADFTGKVIRAYEGDTIIVAGTQNTNGFTAFKGETIAEWMARERPEYERIWQIPLPSFAGKDEAFFIFKRVV